MIIQTLKTFMFLTIMTLARQSTLPNAFHLQTFNQTLMQRTFIPTQCGISGHRINDEYSLFFTQLVKWPIPLALIVQSSLSDIHDSCYPSIIDGRFPLL